MSSAPNLRPHSEKCASAQNVLVINETGLGFPSKLEQIVAPRKSFSKVFGRKIVMLQDSSCCEINHSNRYLPLRPVLS